VRKNLREYSKVFDEQDYNKKNLANKAVIESRRRLLQEWRAWRKQVEERLKEEGLDIKSAEQEAGGEAVEEIVEEIIDEHDEVVT